MTITFLTVRGPGDHMAMVLICRVVELLFHYIHRSKVLVGLLGAGKSACVGPHLVYHPGPRRFLPGGSGTGDGVAMEKHISGIFTYSLKKRDIHVECKERKVKAKAMGY